MGAVLAQEQDGLEKAICYASKALSTTQSKYSATRRELLAVVTFTRHFRYYLLGRKCTITEHSNGCIISKIRMELLPVA